MKFLCTCGHVIRDQTDYLPYKGEIMRDQHVEEFLTYIGETIVDYIKASREGRRDAWLKEFFGDVHDHAKEADDSVVVGMIISRARVNTELLHVYQCRICARLYVYHRVGERDEHKELEEWERWEILEFAPVNHNIQVLEVPGGRVGFDEEPPRP